MLKYIREKLQEEHPELVKPTEDVNDATFMECAHLIQELDDLSEKGTDEGSDRPTGVALNIALEDDIADEEVGNIEYNVLSGRITDEPGDASTHSNMVDSGFVEYNTFTGLRTREDFYQEACRKIQPLIRDSAAGLETRRQEYVETMMEQYHEHLIQEGLFDFGKIVLSEKNKANIPWMVLAEFGPFGGAGSNEYIVKLEVLYELDPSSTKSKPMILKSQVNAIELFKQVQPFRVIREMIHEDYSGDSDYRCKSDAEVWEHVTPKFVVAQRGTSERYSVSVYFQGDWMEDEHYIIYTWTPPVKSNGKSKLKETSNIKQIKGLSNKLSAKAFGKSDLKMIKEYVETSRDRVMPSRFVQEAIDFGQDNNSEGIAAPPAGSASPDAGSIGSVGDVGEAPAADSGMGDPNAELNNTTPTDANASGAEVKVPVNNNDVSDKIVDNIASATQGDSTPDDATAELNNMDTSGEGMEDSSSLTTPPSDLDGIDDTTPDMDTPDTTDLDTSTDDLSGGADIPGDDSEVNAENFDNLSIDDLLAQGQEKLKGLTVKQLRDFLTGESTDPAVTEAFQEAFTFSRTNIVTTLDENLRHVLGILNSANESGVEILAKFKKDSAGLNKALDKAAKLKKKAFSKEYFFEEDERTSMNKLNKCLNDLTIIIGSAKDATYVATIKRLIQAFISEAVAVSKIIEKRVGVKTFKNNKPVIK